MWEQRKASCCEEAHDNRVPSPSREVQVLPLVSTHEQVIGYHLKLCPNYPLDCPNKCGARGVIRSTVPAHQEACPLQRVECEYNQFGCAIVLPRKDMAEHLKTSVEVHLKMTKRRVEQMEEKAERERQKVNIMNDVIDRLVDRVEQLELRKKK